MKRTIFLAVILTLIVAPAMLADDSAALFKSKCQACHGPNGDASSPMAKNFHLKALGSADVQKQSDAELTAIIKNGKGKMPAYKTMTDDQIKGLVALIRTFKK